MLPNRVDSTAFKRTLHCTTTSCNLVQNAQSKLTDCGQNYTGFIHVLTCYSPQFKKIIVRSGAVEMLNSTLEVGYIITNNHLVQVCYSHQTCKFVLGDDHCVALGAQIVFHCNAVHCFGPQSALLC